MKKFINGEKASHKKPRLLYMNRPHRKVICLVLRANTKKAKKSTFFDDGKKFILLNKCASIKSTATTLENQFYL
jgi:hypothetical protein